MRKPQSAAYCSTTCVLRSCFQTLHGCGYLPTPTSTIAGRNNTGRNHPTYRDDGRTIHFTSARVCCGCLVAVAIFDTSFPAFALCTRKPSAGRSKGPRRLLHHRPHQQQAGRVSTAAARLGWRRQWPAAGHWDEQRKVPAGCRWGWGRRSSWNILRAAAGLRSVR